MQDEGKGPMGGFLTSDNSYLSRPNPGLVPGSAGDCTDLPAAVAGFVRASLADNSRRAYLSDLRHFEHWGGRIPASAETVASYLAAHVDTLRVATLVRRIASISKAHQARGVPNPTRSELVRTTLRGIKRKRRCTQQQAKALLREDLLLVLDTMGDDLKDIRDRALLLIGFAGALRRSELVALDVVDIVPVRRGIWLQLRRSKTDQDGRGDKIAIPYGRSRRCPVLALDAWLTASGITEGAIFRPVDRHGHVHGGRLSGEAVSIVVRERVAAAGLDPIGYSGHSLRAGFATSAAQAGVQVWRIKAQTRHASDAMLARYIREGELFRDNAAGALL
jgi:integrase